MDAIWEHSEALATILSVIVAIFAGYIGFKVQQRRHRREYTLEVLSHSLTNTEIMAGKNIIRRLQGNGGCIVTSDLATKEMDCVVNTLNYYEFIGNAFKKGDLDDQIVLEQLAGSFLLTYECAKQYIEHRRLERGRPQTFIGLEKMVEAIRERGY